MEIPRQKKLIHSMDWDYLLLLDACRYDVFEELYEDYLDGELTRAYSSGSQTLEWLSETFPRTYDVTYVSGHSLVNSKGIKSHGQLERQLKRIGGNYEYNPVDHFEKIIDVWKWGESDLIGTVPPEPINDALRKCDGKSLAHYVQPHFPWVRGKQWAREREIKDFPESFTREWVLDNLGVKKLKKAYRENLAFVLEGVEEVVDELSGETVITSDHGFLLREGDHTAGMDEPEVRRVPWLVVR